MTDGETETVWRDSEGSYSVPSCAPKPSSVDFDSIFDLNPNPDDLIGSPVDSNNNTGTGGSPNQAVIPAGQVKCACYDMLIASNDVCNGLCDCPSCEDESF